MAFQAPTRHGPLVFTVVPALSPVALLVLGAVIFQAWPFSQEAQPQVIGMLTAISGETLLHDSHAKETRPAALLSRVFSGDAMETAGDSSMLIALAGPTLLKASSDSRLKLIGPRAIQLEKGLVYLSVAKYPERFRVRTSMGDITVFGTVFTVEVSANAVTVVLKEGEVTVENGVDFAVLYPGEQAVIRQGQASIEKTEVDADGLLQWANAIRPDPAAQAEFVAAIPTLGDSRMRAEQVWWVDMRDRGQIRAMAFTWDNTAQQVSPMSYDVLVYNENMQPLFTRRLEGALLNASDTQQVELEIPDGKALGGKTTFVRLVPDESTGQTEVAFKEVSLIGAAAPVAQ